MLSEVSYGDPINGSKPRRTLLGYVTTHEPKEHTILYETASAYTKVEVPAGRYEIVLSEHAGSRWVLVRYAGIVTDDHYVNRLGASSSIAPKRGIGEHRSCSAQLDTYVAAEAFAMNPDWQLAEDWALSASSYYSEHNQRHRMLYKLVPPDPAQ